MIKYFSIYFLELYFTNHILIFEYFVIENRRQQLHVPPPPPAPEMIDKRISVSGLNVGLNPVNRNNAFPCLELTLATTSSSVSDGCPQPACQCVTCRASSSKTHWWQNIGAKYLSNVTFRCDCSSYFYFRVVEFELCFLDSEICRILNLSYSFMLFCFRKKILAMLDEFLFYFPIF